MDAEIQLKHFDTELKVFLEELQNYITKSVIDSSVEQPEEYLKNCICSLIRCVDKFYQTHQGKEIAYSFYLFLLALIWNMERLQDVSVKKTKEVVVHELIKEEKANKAAFRAKYEKRLFAQKEEYEAKVKELEEKVQQLKKELSETHKQLENLEKKYDTRYYDLTPAQTLVDLARTYDMIKDTINQTYDNELA